jgi:CTP synthase (UTP-ammonia lyase)
MTQPVRIAIVGDYDPQSSSHHAIDEALTHTAEVLSLPVEYSWLPTQSLSGDGAENSLKKFHGLWAAPGSPYDSTEGALKAIRFAREQSWPFFGT